MPSDKVVYTTNLKNNESLMSDPGLSYHTAAITADGGEAGTDCISSEGFSSHSPPDPTLIAATSPPFAAPPPPSFTANNACLSAADITSSGDGLAFVYLGSVDSSHAVTSEGGLLL